MTSISPLIVAIVGPTAVGKTALALELARQINGEIVSVDSRLVYRGMDIGTAKPSPAELATVPHHLIDIISPDTDFSLATFQSLALTAIQQIIARHRVPVLAGGTGQYAAALLEGWTIPRVPPNPEVRARLEADAATHGTPAMFQRLELVDPAAAAAIGPHNLRRLIRALEVWEITGQPISLLQQRHPLPYRIITLALERERSDLYGRIDLRVDQMIHAGLVAEVLGLVRAGYRWELPAMSGLGYAEFAPLWHGSASAAQCIERLKFNTHRFARKQHTWFRRLPGHHPLNAAAPDLHTQALAAVELAQSRP